jgi:hypothetical protein
MGALFTFVFGLWLLGAVVSSPYFWARRTNRSQDPRARRLIAFGYGMTWPYLTYKALAGRGVAEEAAIERDAVTARILGDAEPVSPSRGADSPRRVQNPFD